MDSNLIHIKDYHKMTGMPLRTIQDRVQKGKLPAVREGKDTFIVPQVSLNADATAKVIEEKKAEWNRSLETAHNIYNSKKRCKECTNIINKILDEVQQWQLLFGVKIKGYTKRSLQLKVQKGCIERQTRSDKFKPRAAVIRDNPEALKKAIELTGIFYMKDPLHSLENAIDRARMYAEENEEYYEVRAINWYTMRRQVGLAFKQSGYATMHEYFNHYNLHRKKHAYVKGAFTHDIGHMDVYSLDDHKFDIAGVQEFNEVTGKFEKKHIYSWFVVDIYTMYPLAYEIKTTPFNNDDIVKLLMKVFKKYGKPNVKVICDQGLAADARVIDFCNKCDVVLEPQIAYEPTKKAPNERIFKFCKNESDIYNENFTGSNHPKEGRHRGKRLSPEETTELTNEAIKRYDHYINTYLIDRPRKLPRKGIATLLDNTKRVPIRKLHEHFDKLRTHIPVDNITLRYAYMQQDIVKSFNEFYIMHQKEMYLPKPNSDVPIALMDPKYKVKLSIDPSDLNEIDIYAAQDLLDRFTGNLIEAGKYICTLESLAGVPAGEKAAKVARNNKSFRKKLLEMAREFRVQAAAHGDVINQVITGDGSIKDIRAAQEREIADIIKNAVPMDKIEVAANDTYDEPDIDAGLNDIDSVNNIKIDHE